MCVCRISLMVSDLIVSTTTCKASQVTSPPRTALLVFPSRDFGHSQTGASAGTLAWDRREGTRGDHARGRAQWWGHWGNI